MKFLNNLRKRGLALFLVLTMCLSMLPATAMAASGISVYDHTLAEVKAAFKSQGILQITGASVDNRISNTKSRITLQVGDTGTQTFTPCPVTILHF